MTGRMPDRVWIMEELNILHTMDNPIVVFKAGVVEDPRRWAAAACQLH